MNQHETIYQSLYVQGRGHLRADLPIISTDSCAAAEPPGVLRPPPAMGRGRRSLGRSVSVSVQLRLMTVPFQGIGKVT